MAKEKLLDIKREMAAFDNKDRNFYDNLTPEERKEFSGFLMIRWGATVDGNRDLQEWYLRSTNENLNKNFFDINTTKHEKLQWLMATTVSPGMGKYYHPWLGFKRQTKKGEKFIRQLYPHISNEEVDVMLAVNSMDDLREHARNLGWEEKDIKKELG